MTSFFLARTALADVGLRDDADEAIGSFDNGDAAHLVALIDVHHILHVCVGPDRRERLPADFVVYTAAAGHGGSLGTAAPNAVLW